MKKYFNLLLPLLFMGSLLLGSIALADNAPKAKGGKSVTERYKETCAMCHASGTQGAPRSGVEAQWQVRLAKGMDTLLESVKKGYRQMPPMGVCFECSDDDFIALIEYMAEPGS